MEATNAAPQTIYLKDYQVPAYLLDFVELRFDIEEEKTIVSSSLSFRAQSQGGPKRHAPGFGRRGN